MSYDFPIPFGYNPATAKFQTYDQNKHLITFGPTRSGKFATVLAQVMALAPHSIICIDPKGQCAAVTHRRRRELHGETPSDKRVHFLNPFGELGLKTSRFNPLAHLRIEQPNIVADTRSLADALIIQSQKDAFFTESAVDLLHVLLMHVVAEHGGTDKASLPEVRRLLTLPWQVEGPPKGENEERHGDEEECFRRVCLWMAESEHPFISQPAGRFMGVDGKPSRELYSVISTAITQTSFLDDPKIAHVLSGSDFSMLQLKEKPSTVYLILPGRYLEAYNRFLRLLVTSAIDQLTARAGGHPTLFILDEFYSALKNLNAIAKAFAFAAGYRVQLWPFLQDLPQLKSIYGDNLWESLLANAGMVQFFTPADMTTADYIAKRGGMLTRIKTSHNKAELTERAQSEHLTGWSYGLQGEAYPLLPPEITMSMEGNQQLIFFSGRHGVDKDKQRHPYWKIDRLKGMFDPDPFHE